MARYYDAYSLVDEYVGTLNRSDRLRERHQKEQSEADARLREVEKDMVALLCHASKPIRYAGAVYSLNGLRNGICMHRDPQGVNPLDLTLPEWLNEVYVRGLRVGDGSLDVRLHRHRGDVGVNILDRCGNVEVVILK